MRNRTWVPLALILIVGGFSLQNSLAQGKGGGPKPPPPPANSAIAYDGSGGLTVMDADGTNQRVIFNKPSSYRPNWSPDAGRLVFARRSNNNRDTGIYLINADGSGLCRLAPLNDPRFAAPAWSPWPLADGNHWILYSDADNSTSQYRDLYAVRANCSNPGTPVRLTNTPSQAERDPSWSRFGSQVAVWIAYSGPADVLLYDVAVSNSAPQLSKHLSFRESGLLPIGEYLWPEWGKSDDRIIFTVGTDLWITDLTVGGTYQVTFDGPASWETGPSWSPDGTEIVFLHRSEFSNGLAKLSFRDGVWYRTELPGTPALLSGLPMPRWRRCDSCL